MVAHFSGRLFLAHWTLIWFMITGIGSEKSLWSFQPQPTGAIIQDEDFLQTDSKLWNVDLPTMGGLQFWTDFRWSNGWRVQYNSLSKHWRLLDPKSIRRAWGGKQAMLDELENRVASESQIGDRSTEVVVLIHGLMRTSGCMKSLEQEIASYDQQRAATDPDYVVRTTISYSYASTRESIAFHAAAFREFIEHLPDRPRISVVGHSLGNIVLRHAIGDWQKADSQQVLSRLRRVVMLGPPNQGSEFAKRLSRLGLFETITGQSGMQLGPSWDDFLHHLGTPRCPFMIVAGDISNSPIQNPLLQGASDGIVSVTETQLEGADETLVVPVLHSFLMSDRRVVREVVSFLSENGPRSGLKD